MSLEYNWTRFLKWNFTQKIPPDDFAGVYEDFWVKVTVFVIYFLGLVSCALLTFVSWFEKSGRAGNFRTLVNQLTSLGHDQMCLMFFSAASLDILRIIFGPLPTFVARFFLFFFLWSGVNSATFITLNTVVKFSFVCVFKSIPVMMDNLLAIFMFVTVTFVNFWAVCAKFYIENVSILERICTGIWEEEDKTTIPLGSIYVIFVFGIQISLGIPIFISKSKNKGQTKKDLDSYLTSLITGFVYFFHGLVIVEMMK